MKSSESPSHDDRHDVPFALVVDDDGDMAEEVREAIALPQGAVMLASSLAEAMMKIEENPSIELIVTDYYLVADQARAANGEQLIDCLGYRHPDRVFDFIVISGDPHCFHNLRERKTVTCHAKPLIAEVLLETLVSRHIPLRYLESVRRSRRCMPVLDRSEAVVVAS